MLQAEELLDHASRLVATQASGDVDFRRAVSAAYYSAFHLISASFAEQVSPATPQGLRGRCQRALEHRAMKSSMASFQTQESLNRLSSGTGVPCVFSRDLADIAREFGELQDARHLADYDVVDFDGTVGLAGALDSVEKAKRILEAWDRAKATDEAKLFLASLIFGNRWTK